MIEEILVQYNDSDAALFGPDNMGDDGIDIEASKTKLKLMLEAATEKGFPSSIVKVKAGSGPCEVWRASGKKDHRALYIVREILRETWASFNWLVDVS